MNRDELLDKLAMEFEPVSWSLHKMSGRLYQGYVFNYAEYDKRRTELINRPDDSEAPEWAEWLAQGANGNWYWCKEKPVMSELGILTSGKIKISKGCAPAGHDWRKTLTRINRQPTEAQQHIVDAARLDAQWREAMAACKYTPQEDEAFQALDKKLKRQQASASGILNAAALHMQDRASTYDKPAGERSMAATVDAFRATTGITLTEEQGWHFMALLKLVRSQQGDLRLDSYEDGAAYFALAGEAAVKERKK